MLVSLKVENFKNFKDARTIVLYESGEDSCAFSILIGKNGAGKSSVLDAIEWVVFNRSPKSLRASKKDDLISEGREFTSVEAVFEKEDKEKSSLRISRHHQKGGQTRSLAVLRDSEYITKTFHGVDEIADALHKFCGIGTVDLERILIKQQNASSIACNKPGKLLEYLEMFIGTDKINSAASASFLEGNHISLQRKVILTDVEGILKKVKKLQPSMDTVTTLRAEQLELNNCLLKLYVAEQRLLKIDEALAARKMNSISESHSTILSCVEASKAAVESLSLQIRSISSHERKKRRGKEMCDDLLLASEEQLEMIVLENKRSIQEEAAKLQEVKGLLKLIATHEKSILRLNKSQRELTNIRSDQNIQLLRSREGLRALLDPLSIPVGRSDLSNCGADEDSLVSDRKLHDIKKILNELKELHSAECDNEVWAESLNTLNLDAVSRRENIELTKEKCKEVIKKQQKRNQELRIFDAEIDLLEKECRCAGEDHQKLREKEGEINQAIQLSASAQQHTIQDHDILRRLKNFDLLQTNLRDLPDEGLNLDMIGALCDLFAPLSSSLHTTALLAVLGNTLTQTVVVPTRSTAMAAAQICRRLRMFPLTIDILDEIEQSAIFNNNRQKTLTEKRSDNIIGQSKTASPLIECVTITNHIALPAVSKRLKNWNFFDGFGNEAMQYKERISRQEASLNIVARDGSRIMCDGEIRMQHMPNLALQQSQILIPLWPSSLRDRTNCGTKNSGTSQNDRVNTLKVKAQVSLAEIYYNEVNIQLDEKRGLRNEISARKQALEKELVEDFLDGKCKKVTNHERIFVRIISLYCITELIRTFCKKILNNRSCDIASIEDLQVRLDCSLKVLIVDERRIKEDFENLRQSKEDLKMQNGMLLSALSLLLPTQLLEDGEDLKEEVLMEIERHEQMVLQIANTDSQERMMETELTVLKSSIAKQKKIFEALHNSTESNGNASSTKKKSARGPQEEEYFKQEIQRLQEIFGMAKEECNIRMQQFLSITTVARDHISRKNLAAADLDRLRKKETKTEGLLKKAHAKVISITQAVESKALMITQMQKTLSIAATALPHLDIREGDGDSDGKHLKVPLSTSLPLNGEAFSTANLANPQEEKKEEEASTPDDFFDSEPEHLMTEDKFDRAPLKSNSASGIVQYGNGRLKNCKGARSRSFSFNNLAEDSDVENVEGATKCDLLFAEAKEDPPLVYTGQHDFHEVQLANLKEDNSKLRKRKRIMSGSADMSTKIQVDSGGDLNVLQSYDAVQLDLLSGQLSIRSKDLERRAKDVDFEAIIAEYSGLLFECKAASGEAKRLNSQARAEQRRGNELQAKRFSLLTHYLQQISAKLSQTYKRIVPGADCYLNYAPNPISLFEEGATLLAQHGRSAWREACHLSGGQQAACSLSLILAIQDCFQSPIYIMDEVDASLDTSTVARVGALLREKSLGSKVQFLLVSHRPEMQECASRLVGLYICNEMPQVLSWGFCDSYNENDSDQERNENMVESNEKLVRNI